MFFVSFVVNSMPDIGKRLVVALGGNAISAPGKVGDIDEQFAQVSETAEVLCDAIERGYHLIVTHGNGPQVGNVLRRVELARGELYPIPLEVCVADTQAGMGYMIAQCLSNAMNRRNLTCDVTAVVTTVLVDPNDPAFRDPNKAIGPMLTEAQARPIAPRTAGKSVVKAKAVFVAWYRRRSLGKSSRCPRLISSSRVVRLSSAAEAGAFPSLSIQTAASAALRPLSTKTALPASWLATSKRRRS